MASSEMEQGQERTTKRWRVMRSNHDCPHRQYIGYIEPDDVGIVEAPTRGAAIMRAYETFHIPPTHLVLREVAK